MDKAIRYTDEEIEFDFAKHIVIFNKVGEKLSAEVEHETGGLYNNARYFEIENTEKLQNDVAIDTLLDVLYDEYEEENVYVTMCDNRFYKAIVIRIDDEESEVYAEIHIHFVTTGAENRIMYLLKTKIELPFGIISPVWESVSYKGLCDEMRSFAQEFGVRRYKSYKCHYPVFFVVGENGNVEESDYNRLLEVLRELRKRYEFGEWDAEKHRFIVVPRFL